MKKQTRFLVDENLLGLVRKLRMMGFDAITLINTPDKEILQRAQTENRIILTKDRRFFTAISSIQAHLVQSDIVEDQLNEVLKLFPLSEQEEALSRCLECNTPIEEISKQQAKDRVDEKTWRIYDKFFECPTCHRIYWEGSHFEKLQRKVQSLKDKI